MPDDLRTEDERQIDDLLAQVSAVQVRIDLQKIPEGRLRAVDVVHVRLLRAGMIECIEALSAYRARVMAGLDGSPDELRDIIHALSDRLEQTEKERDALRDRLSKLEPVPAETQLELHKPASLTLTPEAEAEPEPSEDKPKEKPAEKPHGKGRGKGHGHT